jgi:hypothetical protein
LRAFIQSRQALPSPGLCCARHGHQTKRATSAVTTAISPKNFSLQILFRRRRGCSVSRPLRSAPPSSGCAAAPSPAFSRPRPLLLAGAAESPERFLLHPVLSIRLAALGLLQSMSGGASPGRTTSPRVLRGGCIHR